jgi:hypothetical protein
LQVAPAVMFMKAQHGAIGQGGFGECLSWFHGPWMSGRARPAQNPIFVQQRPRRLPGSSLLGFLDP